MLKLIFSLLPSLVLSSVVALPSETIAIAAEIKPTTVQMAQGPDGSTFNEENVRQMTVKVSTATNQGSGTLIGQQGNNYLVLTNAHILNGDTTLQIQTHDGHTHAAQVVPNAFEQGYDLALVKFESSTSYQISQISTASPRIEWSLLTGGYAAESGTFQSGKGELLQTRFQPLAEGYQLGYSGDVPQGMSGGPIFHESGILIGIQGKSKFALIDEYVNQDGTAIPPEEIQRLRQRNWGIPIRTVLAQIQQPLLVAYKLPLPKTDIGITRPKWTGWTAELEAKAKGFTVLIENTTEDKNGSGVIIAKQGNTYTVLTSEHNFKEEEGVSARFTLTTPDGQTYPLNKSGFRLEPGVDLAVVEFESDNNYPVATLAQYQQEDYSQVFAAGFPDPLGQGSPQWLMSGGLVFEREQGRLLTIERTLVNKQQEGGHTQSASSTAFDLGYDLLYTSITYKGMSGGPVLDHQGRVIGIHGLAESENEGNFDGQGKKEQLIKLGNSLGIPIQTFLGLAPRLQIYLNNVVIEENKPASLTSQQINSFRKSLQNAVVPTGNAKPEVLIERGNQLHRIGLDQQAIDTFDQVIALNQGYKHLAYFGKGQALVNLAIPHQGQEEYVKRLRLSIQSLQKSVTLAPNYTPAWQSLALVYQWLGEYKLALESINQAIKKQSEDVKFYKANLYNEKWLILDKLERYEEALVEINSALKLSERAALYSNRGTAYNNLQRYAEAIKDFDQAILINPKNANFYNNRGIAYDNLQRYEEAIQDYTQAILINPKKANSYYNRGSTYLQHLLRYAEAIKDFDQAILINPKLVEAYNQRGIAYADLQRYEEAIQDYTQAILINPKFALAYYNRGNTYSNLQRYTEAIKDFDKTILINSKYSNAYVNRGTAYNNLQRHAEAIQDFDQAILINPKDALAYSIRGLVYLEMGNKIQAKQDLESAAPLFRQQNNQKFYQLMIQLLREL